MPRGRCASWRRRQNTCVDFLTETEHRFLADNPERVFRSENGGHAVRTENGSRAARTDNGERAAAGTVGIEAGRRGTTERRHISRAQRVGGLLILAVCVGAALWYVPRVVAADQRSLTGTVTSTGVIDLNFAKSGQLSKINVHMGQQVAKGEHAGHRVRPGHPGGGQRGQGRDHRGQREAGRAEGSAGCQPAGRYRGRERAAAEGPGPAADRPGQPDRNPHRRPAARYRGSRQWPARGAGHALGIRDYSVRVRLDAGRHDAAVLAAAGGPAVPDQGHRLAERAAGGRAAHLGQLGGRRPGSGELGLQGPRGPGRDDQRARGRASAAWRAGSRKSCPPRSPPRPASPTRPWSRCSATRTPRRSAACRPMWS